MRRIAAIALLVLAVGALLVAGVGAGGDEDGYEVRAIFDNAAFLVPGEEVRIAGANVGVVAEVDVTGEEEAAHEDGAPQPGKAVVVLRIDDPAFQDFRTDASCLIRPQSLIGEKYVECRPTQPRAPGSEPPPELETVADGEPGEGQRLLPLESNGKTVDLDLVNDIMEEPYPDRFRLILNDLGAGLAARGEELAEIVERSNPALRETNRVLAILDRQRDALARLASDSDAILSALARERESVAGFINEAETTGAATAERAADLEAGIARLPGFLRELRSTMIELRGFSDEATPVFADLGVAAPSLTRATEALGPFSSAGTRAFVTLGDAAEEAGPPLAESDPVIRQLRGLADSAEPAAVNLRQLLASLRETGGYEELLKLVFNTVGSINGFDQYGHFLRALLPLNNCVDYESVPEPGCSAAWGIATGSPTTPLRALARRALREERSQRAPSRDAARSGAAATEKAGTSEADESPGAADSDPGGLSAPGAEGEPGAPGLDDAEPPPAGAAAEQGPGAGVRTAGLRATRDLLEFLIGRRGSGARR